MDFGTVGLGVLMFTLVILALVVILLAAKAKLVSSGDVKIIINDDESKPLVVPAGDTLLNALSSQKIFIPSACGGGGTCGVCKVHVHSGGGSILPTELTHVSRGEAREGCRLSCQVKVKQDMHIEVEPEIFSVQKMELQDTLQPQRSHLHQRAHSGASGRRKRPIPCGWLYSD